MERLNRATTASRSLALYSRTMLTSLPPNGLLIGRPRRGRSVFSAWFSPRVFREGLGTPLNTPFSLREARRERPASTARTEPYLEKAAILRVRCMPLLGTEPAIFIRLFCAKCKPQRGRDSLDGDALLPYCRVALYSTTVATIQMISTPVSGTNMKQ